MRLRLLLLMAGEQDTRPLGQLGTDLARRWANQRLAAVQAYGRILAEYGAGRTTTAAAAGSYARLMAEEAVRYSADAIGLATDLATALLRNAGGRLETNTPGGSPVQDLELAGPLGGEATTTFLLQNPHERPASVTLAPGAFTGPAGDTGATVRLEPTQVELAPLARQAVRVSAALDPEVFEAGSHYAANVAISGFDDLILRVRLSVLPA